MSDNIAAFQNMIGISELGQQLIDETDGGYNVLVGSLPGHPLTFSDYSDHPHITMGFIDKALDSTAAGKYQIIYPTWLRMKKKLSLPDFSPPSQDAAAQELISERNALTDVENGNIVSAITKCNPEWASLPGNYAGQHQNTINYLITAYQNSGGTTQT